jgi:hypothetical protein
VLDEDATIPLPCPKCGHTTDKSIGWLEANNNFVCCGCGETIPLEDGELLRALSNLEGVSPVQR